MGIVKIGHRGASNSNRQQQSSHSSTINERPFSLNRTDDDLSDSDLSDVGCELAIVEDQICNIPYDLYHLSNLKDVLSLETWNSCLTDEERLYLAAYLPSMDEDTFGITIKELLCGNDLFFGSPLEKLFDRLKGGFYSIQVAPVREGLKFLHKIGYYHSLRLYHEGMNQKFEDMRRAWSNCLPSTSTDERVRIWKKKKDQKRVLLVDLNAIPSDEETLSKVDKRADFPLLKKTKYIDEEVIKPSTQAINFDIVAASMKPKGKGVLKVRSVEMSSTLSHLIRPLSSDYLEPGKRVPKGLLKIKPKADDFGQRERAITTFVPPGQTSASLLGIHAARLSPPLSSPYLHHINSNENKINGSNKFGPSNVRQREAFANIPLGTFSNSQNFSGTIKTVLSSRMLNATELNTETFPVKNNQRLKVQSDEAGDFGDRRVLCATSPDADLFALKNHQAVASVHHTVPGDIGMSLDDRQKYDTDRGLSITSASTIASAVEREIVFPITYKRKKAATNLKQAPPPSKTDCNLAGKAKSVKIKVKGWSDRGLLNGLKRGSPSS